ALGLEIARMAGIPHDILQRARSAAQPGYAKLMEDARPTGALHLAEQRVLDSLRDIDIASTTPLQALLHVAELQERLRAAEREQLGPRMLHAAEDQPVYERAD
ncbi:MAG: hypothetical protein DCC58_15105, partial [Chloroflexi bacterium]